jgi:hypothetical protein
VSASYLCTTCPLINSTDLALDSSGYVYPHVVRCSGLRLTRIPVWVHAYAFRWCAGLWVRVPNGRAVVSCGCSWSLCTMLSYKQSLVASCSLWVRVPNNHALILFRQCSLLCMTLSSARMDCALQLLGTRTQRSRCGFLWALLVTLHDALL